jgi:hypothetical protein
VGQTLAGGSPNLIATHPCTAKTQQMGILSYGNVVGEYSRLRGF